MIQRPMVSAYLPQSDPTHRSSMGLRYDPVGFAPCLRYISAMKPLAACDRDLCQDAGGLWQLASMCLGITSRVSLRRC
jgi:hypothetical protein